MTRRNCPVECCQTIVSILYLKERKYMKVVTCTCIVGIYDAHTQQQLRPGPKLKNAALHKFIHVRIMIKKHKTAVLCSHTGGTCTVCTHRMQRWAGSEGSYTCTCTCTSTCNWKGNQHCHMQFERSMHAERVWMKYCTYTRDKLKILLQNTL